MPRTGYIIEFAEKESFFAEYGKVKKAICTSKKLASTLNDWRYLVYSARFMNFEMYQEDHPEEFAALPMLE